MSHYDTLDHAKSVVSSKLDTMRYRGEQPAVGEWIEWLEHLSSELESIDLNDLHDDCYSSDQISELVGEELGDRVADETIKLRKRIEELEEQLERRPKRRPRIKTAEVRQAQELLKSQYETLKVLRKRAQERYSCTDEDRIARREYDRLSDALTRVGSQIKEMDQKLRSA